MENFMEKLAGAKVVPVVKIEDANRAPALAEALLAGGLPVIEITFRTAAAAEAIRLVAQEVPEMTICAGTVLTPGQAETAIDSGARAIVSPGTNPEVVRFCQDRGVPVIPGCATPTEVEACLRMGLNTLKLFPAEAIGGIPLLKALSGPYADVKFMPTGGISPENLRDYLTLPNVVACGGSWLTPKKLMDAGDFEEIRRLAGCAAALAGN